MNIENLKKILESERIETSKQYGLDKFPVHNIQTTKDFTQDINFARRMTYSGAFKSGHEAATNRLLPLLEKAIEMAEFYNGLYVFSESDDDSEQLHIDKPWRYSSGKRAREFLSEFTKMAEINKDELK